MYLAEICTISTAQESLNFIRGWTNQWALAQHSKCDPNTMDIGAANSKACYNYGKEGHFTKNCPKSINTCLQCKWLRGNHKKGSKKGSQDTHEVHMSWDDDKSTSSDDEHEVHKASKGNGNGKGHDFMAFIKGMNFDKAYTWFKDQEAIHKKSGKA